MYLKEGNIGKAESEEVVPVKTETKIMSQAGSAGSSPRKHLPGSCVVGDRPQGAFGGSTSRESFLPMGSFNLRSNPRREKTSFADEETGGVNVQVTETVSKGAGIKMRLVCSRSPRCPCSVAAPPPSSQPGSPFCSTWSLKELLPWAASRLLPPTCPTPPSDRPAVSPDTRPRPLRPRLPPTLLQGLWI